LVETKASRTALDEASPGGFFLLRVHLIGVLERKHLIIPEPLEQGVVHKGLFDHFCAQFHLFFRAVGFGVNLESEFGKIP
jgi:hypothetical protein